MIRATTAKGTPVFVETICDVYPNENGYYCEIYLNSGGDRFDDFCIHPDDCDCNNEWEVRRFVEDYVASIIDY